MKFTIRSEHHHGITYDLDKLVSVGDPFGQHETWWSFWLSFDNKREDCIDIICDNAEEECRRIHKELIDAWKSDDECSVSPCEYPEITLMYEEDHRDE